jgi:hypothetical protein
MRLPSFRLPKSHASAIYLSATPLFDFSLGRRALADGSYRSIADGTAIEFKWQEDAYRVSGDATPETVTLIPIPQRPSTFVFQQSNGRSTSFFGALTATLDEPEFRLFSPESQRDAAIRYAKTSGATLGDAGCIFTGSDTLLAALLLLLKAAPAHSWSTYDRA